MINAVPWMLATTQLIGWMLVHFLWQAVVVGLIYRIIKGVMPRGEARYWLGMITLITLALCPLLTMWQLLGKDGQGVELMPVVRASLAAPAVDLDATWDAWLDSLLPWLVLGWFCGVFFLSWRAWTQWRELKVLVQLAELVSQWQIKTDAIAKRFDLTRQIHVLCSRAITTPVIVGWFRPVILLPMAVVCNFSMAQIELILAHELAHLRRWDPLANLFQLVLETLHFYHPVVHWISRDVRNEREICCDEMALKFGGGSRREFAATLARLSDVNERRDSLLLAASGGVLLDRVQQIVMPRSQPASFGLSARVVALFFGLLLAAVTLQVEWSRAELQQDLDAPLRGLEKALLLPEFSVAITPVAPPTWTDSVALHVAAVRSLSSASIEMAPAHDLLPAPIARPALQSPRLKILSLQIADVAHAAVASPMRVSVSTAPVISTEADVSPRPISMRAPVYPQSAWMQGIEGRVVVEFSIAANGGVKNMRVITAEPNGVFDEAALRRCMSEKYEVGTVQSDTRYRQTLAFTLDPSHHAPNLSSHWSGSKVIQVQMGCQISTGTHICRSPSSGAGSAAGASQSVAR